MKKSASSAKREKYRVEVRLKPEIGDEVRRLASEGRRPINAQIEMLLAAATGITL